MEPREFISLNACTGRSLTNPKNLVVSTPVKPILLLVVLLSSSAFALRYGDGCLATLRLTVPAPPARDVKFLTLPTESDLIASSATPRLMNGSVLLVSTPEGEKSILVLSDYLHGHRQQPMALPEGWKVVRKLHRGEFEIANGVIIKANETSGEAFVEGYSVGNKVETLMEYLRNSRLVTGQTDFDPFNKNDQHYYKGFDEPGGTPKGLHKKRDVFKLAIGTLRTTLESDLEEILIGDKEMLPLFAEHWAIYSAGLNSEQLMALAPLTAGIEKLKSGTAITKDESAAMLKGCRLIDQKIERTYVIEVK